MVQDKKYDIRDDGRIVALRDIPRWHVKAGDLGGHVGGEDVLGQSGDAWVEPGGTVSATASVGGDALIRGVVADCARVGGEAVVLPGATVCGYAIVHGTVDVCEGALVAGHVVLGGMVRVCPDARVHGFAMFGGAEIICSYADVSHPDHVLSAQVVASSSFKANLCRTIDGHRLQVGCWDGTVEEFRMMIESDEWVEADDAAIKRRRPEMLAFASMCEARIATWGGEEW